MKIYKYPPEMEQEELKKKLRELSDEESLGVRDNLKHVVLYNSEYLHSYGPDNWINQFRSSYLDMRRAKYFKEYSEEERKHWYC
jgi:hypothetical protein